MWNHPLGGGEVSERGGTFVGPTQDHIIDLAKALGVGTFPTFNEGENVTYIGGEPDRVERHRADRDRAARPDDHRRARHDRHASSTRCRSEVPVDAPWEAAKAREWDGQTLETWIRDNSATQRFRELVPLATRPIFGAEPRELSLLFVLFYIAASGDETHAGTFERNFNTRDGAQMFRARGRLAAPWSRRWPPRSARRLVLRQPVRRIAQRARRRTGRRPTSSSCARSA